MYLQKGAKIKNFDVKYYLSYIELPLLFRYMFPIQATAKPYVIAGPTLGLLLSAQVKGVNGQEEDIKDETKSLDVGLSGGAGVRLPIGSNTLFAELRYVLGLTKINDDNVADVKNRGIHLLVGISFPVGGK